MNAPELATIIMLPDGVKKVTEKPETKFLNASTFVIELEDHTMGNIIRMRLLDNPKVRYAGYRIPHPLRTCIEIQTVDLSYTPAQALEDSLVTIQDTYSTLKAQFMEQLKRNEHSIQKHINY